MSWKTSSGRPLCFGGDNVLLCLSLSTYRFTDSTFQRIAFIPRQGFQQTELHEYSILIYQDDIFMALTGTYGLALGHSEFT